MGELRYLVAHYFRGETCNLCTITHSPWRRKAGWDQAVRDLGVPFDLLHMNELSPDLARFVDDRAACVVAEDAGVRSLLVTDDELAALDGSVRAFFLLLRDRLSTL